MIEALTTKGETRSIACETHTLLFETQLHNSNDAACTYIAPNVQLAVRGTKWYQIYVTFRMATDVELRLPYYA